MKIRKRDNAYILKLCQIIGIALLCIVLCVSSYKFTMSWFKDESITSNGKPSVLIVGTVNLHVETDFNFYNLVLAPDTLYTSYIDGSETKTYATRLTVEEENDVRSIYVRAKFTTNRDELTLYFGDTLTTSTSYEKERDYGKWYLHTDGYYYYIGSVGEDINGVGMEEVKFNLGYFVDNTLDNSVATENVSMEFVFESIQRPYGAYDVVWDAPTVFDQFALLDTGYPKA